MSPLVKPLMQQLQQQPVSSMHCGYVAEARQGRDMQRYGDGKRLCAGCVPVRPAPGTHGQEMQILLVSSRGGKGYGLPKGGWEVDESMEDAAQRETLEEAGVRGTLEGPVLGEFEFRSGKPGLPEGEGHCAAFVFVMHVTEELACWPEGSERHRTWFSVHEALQNCRHDWMRSAIHAWLQRSATPP